MPTKLLLAWLIILLSVVGARDSIACCHAHSGEESSKEEYLRFDDAMIARHARRKALGESNAVRRGVVQAFATPDDLDLYPVLPEARHWQQSFGHLLHRNGIGAPLLI